MVGKTVGHYRIIEELGRGGMGEVYLAEDTRLDRQAALKFLLPGTETTAEQRARFVREAKAASALDHPNICTIYEAGEADDGRSYIAMAYCAGGTLDERIAGDPLPLEEALDLAIQIARGLQCAHEAGIVHRDIKPTNILIASDGTAKIVDFGVAAISGATRLTQTGTSIGTVSYAAPEQLRGEQVDHRADIYSLGVLVYEMVTGRRPFEAEHPQGIVNQVLSHDPEPLTGVRSGVPIELDRVVFKAMGKRPNHRYQHADDLLVDLRQLCSSLTGTTSLGEGVQGASPRRTNRARRILRYAGPVALLVGAIVLVLARGALVSQPTRLALLPFESAGSQETEILGVGLRTTLYQSLLGFQALEPVVLSAVDYQLDRGLAPLEAARQTGASFALEGRVQQSIGEDGEQRVQISTEIVALDEERVILPFSRNARLGDLFSLQNDLAAEILDVLSLRISTAERASISDIPSSNPESITAYLRGVAARRGSQNSEVFDRAIEMFELATQHDPRFGWAWAQLAEAVAHRFHTYGVPANGDSLAGAALEQAEALAPESASVVRARGYFEYYVEFDYAAAEEAFREAARLNPSDAEIHYYRALNLRRMGEWRQAFGAFERADELDPQWGRLLYNYAKALLLTRDYEGAEEMLTRLRALEAGKPVPTWPEPWALLEILSRGETVQAGELVRQYPRSMAVAGSLAPYRRLLLRNLAAYFASYRFDRSNSQYHLTQAQIAIGLGDMTKALSELDGLDASFTRDPTSSDA